MLTKKENEWLLIFLGELLHHIEIGGCDDFDTDDKEFENRVLSYLKVKKHMSEDINYLSGSDVIEYLKLRIKE